MSSPSRRKSSVKSRSPKPKSDAVVPKLPRSKRLVEGIDAVLAAKAQEVFSLYDRDVDGRIAHSQVILALRGVGLNPSEKEVQHLLQTSVPAGEPGVQFRQFLAIVGRVDTSKDTQEELEEAFRVWDKRAGGHISQAQLRTIMTSMGEKLTEEELEEMMSMVELDERGAVKYRDLISLMLSDVV